MFLLIHLLQMEDRTSQSIVCDKLCSVSVPQVYFKLNRLKRKHSAQVKTKGAVLLKLSFISITATKVQLIFLTTFYFRAAFNMSAHNIRNV